MDYNRLIRKTCKRHRKILKETHQYLMETLDKGNAFDTCVALERCINKWIEFFTFGATVLEIYPIPEWQGIWQIAEKWSDRMEILSDKNLPVRLREIPFKELPRIVRRLEHELREPIIPQEIEPERKKILEDRLIQARNIWSIGEQRYVYQDELPVLTPSQVGVSVCNDDGTLYCNDEHKEYQGVDLLLVCNSRLFRLYETVLTWLRAWTKIAHSQWISQERVDQNVYLLRELLKKELCHAN